ncbi:DCC1-like thiol-disulfide oxidoreductase family protein [Virgibacillus sp. Bac332]|uniref:DCC1-like thiol-disulfide oxidoreductase family protein n=1 Tax=Virgibacillus sp. Bac332 TaxID=2419842 RepID=UPI000EF55B4E|nr:DCC1-like thiol-disulfide oxidoreductase family protein [Virgibacillus sp. Bac332]
MFKKLLELNQTQHMLIGASLIRICFGFIILYNYVIHYSQRYFLWGHNGIMGTQSNGLSLYGLSQSNLYFDILYHIGILVAFLFLIGYKGRITSVLNFIFVWSLMAQNNIILDGGDNISRILLLYLLFANTTSYFSVDKVLRLRNKKAVIKDKANQLSLTNLLHNLAIVACLAQVSILYLTSGLHKAMGELWQNGTALYYILQVNEFSHPYFKDILLSSELLLVIGAYFTIIVQLAFPFLLFNNKLKYFAMFGVISMHLGIAVVMGLVSFSFIMICNQLLFLTDKEYHSLSVNMKQLYSKMKRVFMPKRNQDLSAEQNIKTVIVLYDGWCPFCIKSINKFRKLDWLKRIEFQSFRESSTSLPLGVDISMLERRMYSIILPTNKLENGINSINRICKNIPFLWFFVPLLSLSSKIGMGQKVYDWIANRRTIFPTGSCNEKTCEIPIKK